MRLRARAVEDDELSVILFVTNRVTKSRAQGRNARAHRHEDEVFTALLFKPKARADHFQQFQRITRLHLVNRAARAQAALDEKFYLFIFGRAGESEVGR